MVRVRFAPSPTGKLHIGGLRTLLYNVFLAKRHGGTFILRIEDTDAKRFDPTSEAYIHAVLDWLGIMPDEGPKRGGPFGPYRQSERKDSYAPYALELVKKGKAYYAFDTPEALEAMRARQRAVGVQAPKYDAITRMSMQNSITLSKEEVASRLATNHPYVIRMHVHSHDVVKFHDSIRGWVQVKGADLDDKVLLKEDGMPTYHLANVVDDRLMQITHVIRGEEWLPSTPLHVLLYEALGWPMPVFAHLPLLLRSDGQGKISKRMASEGNLLTFPIAWEEVATGKYFPGFREAGYLPEALINFIALLGWHPGDSEEVLTYEALCEKFSLEKINKAGVRVDIAKANWFNQQHIQRISPAILAKDYVLPTLPDRYQQLPLSYIQQVCKLVQKRLVFPRDVWHYHAYFFVAPTAYPMNVVQKKWHTSLVPVWRALIESLDKLLDFAAEHIYIAMLKGFQENSIKSNALLPLVRIAMTGTTRGPALSDVMALLGKKEVIKRLQNALSAFIEPT